jgi:Leucine-rich repeat (LRR) protein
MLEPTEIYKLFRNQNMKKDSAIQSLIHIIENSGNEKHRVLCLKYLNKMSPTNGVAFKLLENLLISDPNENIRNYALQCLNVNYNEKSFPLIKWAISIEKHYNCYVSLIRSLLNFGKKESKIILIGELRKLIQNKYFDIQGHYSNNRFTESLRDKDKTNNFIDCSSEELANVIIDYKTISQLIKKFSIVFCEWERGRVIKLDLSRLISNWSAWSAWIYKLSLGISHLSEISEILNLQKLRFLNLSNNKLTSIQILIRLKCLTHLYLKNNKIRSLETLKHLKHFPALQYLDLRGNPLTEFITQKDFPNIRIVKD